MKIMIFDVRGEYGHFRKFNTTSSPLTYLIPTRTSLSGLLGAVTGYGREEFYHAFSKDKAHFAVQVLHPLKKQGISFNLINTKEGMNRIKTRTQVKFEFVKNPAYRIFFSHTDSELMKLIENRLRIRDYIFYPYLGLAQLIADVRLITVTEAEQKLNDSDKAVQLLTAVNLKKCLPEGIRIDPELRYSSAIMPLEILPDLNNLPELLEKGAVIPKNRYTNDYAEVIIETTGQPVDAYISEFHSVEQYGNIAFL